MLRAAEKLNKKFAGRERNVCMLGCRPLTEEETHKVIPYYQGTYRHRNVALFAMGCMCGFRIRECLSIRVQDVLQNGTILERVKVERKNMKGSRSARSVVINRTAAYYLAVWIDRLKRIHGYVKPDAYVFQSRAKGNRAISYTQAYRVIVHPWRDAGLTGSLGTHSMRKTFADRVYKTYCKLHRQGEIQQDPLRMTSKAMGHANIDTTDRYLSFRTQDIDDVVESLCDEF